MKKISLTTLTPGTEVTVMNCATTGRIIRRTRMGCYIVAFKGVEIEMQRSKHNLIPLGQKTNY
jgi:hypothetical protein